jgi:glucose-1-phosphate thymidylyltransferase
MHGEITFRLPGMGSRAREPSMQGRESNGVCMQAVVLAAGFGKRMGRYKENPKALLEIGGKPLLDHLLAFLGGAPGLDRVNIRTNALYYPLFKEWLKKSDFTGLVELCSNGAHESDARLGAVGDLGDVCSKKNIADDLIITAADSIFDFSIAPFLEFASSIDGDVVAVTRTKARKELRSGGVVKLTNDSRVIEFEEKPDKPASDLLALPLYRMSRQTITQLQKYMTDGNDKDNLGSFFAWSYRRRPLHAFRIEGERHHVTDLASYKRIASLFENRS